MKKLKKIDWENYFLKDDKDIKWNFENLLCCFYRDDSPCDYKMTLKDILDNEPLEEIDYYEYRDAEKEEEERLRYANWEDLQIELYLDKIREEERNRE